jgi:hypothetical protein
MLPIVLLEITYKTIWLIVVGFPLLSAGTLDGRAEEMMFSFGLVVLTIVATPWGYAFRTHLRREDHGTGAAVEPSMAADEDGQTDGPLPDADPREHGRQHHPEPRRQESAAALVQLGDGSLPILGKELK